MEYSYKTKGTCSSRIDFELDGNVLTKTFKFTVGASDAAKIKADINALSVPSTVSGDFNV